MNSETNIAAINQFPVLARDVVTGMVVLFSNEKVGTVVYLGKNTDYKVGFHSNEWYQPVQDKSWCLLKPGDSVTLTM